MNDQAHSTSTCRVRPMTSHRNGLVCPSDSPQNQATKPTRMASICSNILVFLLGLAGSISDSHAIQVRDDIKIELSGFSLSEAFSIQDDQPFEIDQPNLIRLIYRLWQTSLINLEKYSQYTDDVDLETMLADPPGYRLQVFETKGRAKAVQKIALPGASEEPRFVYRIRCVSQDERPFELLSLQAPRTWLDVNGLDQPISSYAFFYAMIAESAGSDKPTTVPLFLAKQVSWYPNSPNPELGITADLVLLANQDVDIALLDSVHQEDRKPLGRKDTRPFYQFLEAVGKINVPAGHQKIDHMDLLRHPKQSLGRFVSFQARVKKCSVVRLPVDLQVPGLPDAQYYQLMVFPDLRDSRDEPTMVEIGQGDERLTYRRFPFTICCRQLPNGMNSASIENQQVWVEGFFYRFWQYDAERTRSAGAAPQISPILIANRPTMVESNEVGLKRFFNSVVMILIAVLAIVCFTIFRIARRIRSTKQGLPEKLDIDGLAQM